MMDCEYNPIRQYIQFNDLVFTADTITSAEYKVSSKVTTHPYSFKHGSYAPFKSEQLLLEEGTLGLTIHIDYRKYRKEDRKYLKDFIRLNIFKAGRIWAIEDNKILWAYAYVTDYSDTYSKYKGYISIDLDFNLYEGYWHIADMKKIFLVPFNTCDALEGYDFKDELLECVDCCAKCGDKDPDNYCEECTAHCEDLTEENNACVVGENVMKEFLECTESYKIVYDCKLANKIFGDKMNGKKLCKKDYCDTAIAGKIYYPSVLSSEFVDITLTGKWQNPTIDINGDKLTILGDYDGTLKVGQDGSVTYQGWDEKCCPVQDIDFNDTEWDSEQGYGFLIHQGKNRIVVRGSCCEMGCIYVNVDSITM